MRYVIALAAIPVPLLMWTAWPAAVPPVTVKVIRTEGVTARRLDDTTFSARWRPVIPLPAATWAKQVAADETLAGGSNVGSTTARQPSRRIVQRAVLLRRDVCARHGMRKVMVGKYRWRCRR